jgi:hypothetical protein
MQESSISNSFISRAYSNSSFIGFSLLGGKDLKDRDNIFKVLSIPFFSFKFAWVTLDDL